MSYYITVKQSPRYHQMSLEEFLSDSEVVFCYENAHTTGTRTYKRDKISDKFKNSVCADKIIDHLNRFNDSIQYLNECDRNQLYDFSKRPKRSGGLRDISAPKEPLMSDLKRLKSMLEFDFKGTAFAGEVYRQGYRFNGELYHTNAYAYIKGRCTVDAIKVHQRNESKWVLKLDMHDFFGSTTLDFVIKQMSMMFPFSEVIETPGGEDALRRALDSAFLNGGLPQGTPISPLITNIMMIPIDYEITKYLRDIDSGAFVYCRYADDFFISSKYSFKFTEIKEGINRILKQFDTPFGFNEKKTHYGSTSGSNWMLGLMLNKDNEITVGNENKRVFKAMVFSYMKDRENGKPWPIEDIQYLEGKRSYYTMVEGEKIDKILMNIGNKFHKNVYECIKKDLRRI